MNNSEFKNIDIIKASKAYAQLKREIDEAKILDRDYLYYYIVIVIVFLGFFTGVALIYFSNTTIGTILSSIFFVMFATQMAGLMHDSGHRAVFKSNLANDLLGTLSSGLIAFTFRRWRISHDQHHASPNHEEDDPDIDRPFMAFTKEQAKNAKPILKALIRYQVYTYFPFSAFTGIYVQIAGIVYFFKNFNIRRSWEIILYAAGFFVWLFLPALVFDFQKALLVYFTVYSMLGLYLFNIFAPNHKGMPFVAKGQRLSFFEQQIATSRNIKGGFLTDLLLIYLNYQIEHHLFPNCPRNKLKLITPYVKKLCKQQGLEYTQVSLVDSNKIILKELHWVAMTV